VGEVPAELVNADVPVEEVAVQADHVQEEDHLECTPWAVLRAGLSLNAKISLADIIIDISQPKSCFVIQ